MRSSTGGIASSSAGSAAAPRSSSLADLFSTGSAAAAPRRIGIVSTPNLAAIRSRQLLLACLELVQPNTQKPRHALYICRDRQTLDRALRLWAATDAWPSVNIDVLDGVDCQPVSSRADLAALLSDRVALAEYNVIAIDELGDFGTPLDASWIARVLAVLCEPDHQTILVAVSVRANHDADTRLLQLLDPHMELLVSIQCPSGNDHESTLVLLDQV